MDEPTPIERKYLRYLIDRTGSGPHLPIGGLTSAGMRAWIEVLVTLPPRPGSRSTAR